MMRLVDNKYMLIGAACAGLAVAYMLYRTAGKAGELVKEGAQAINPLNNDNVINRGFTSIYQGVTGSTGDLGSDIYDGTHGGAIDITSTNNVINQALGDPASAIADTVYGWFH